MTALPLKTSISDTYPNPSNATARAGFAQLWDAINETIEKPELDLASATTCDIGGQLSTKLRITGTTTITSFGSNYRGPILLRMVGALTITHNDTTLRCPGSTNITTAAGDTLVAWPTATISGAPDGWQVAMLGNGASGGVISSTVTLGSAVSLVNNVEKNITSISLTAGDWNVYGSVIFLPAATTNVSHMQGSVSVISATVDSIARFINITAGGQVPGASPLGYAVPAQRISISSPTTMYLVAVSAFTVSTMAAYGRIWARRVK